MATNLPMSVRSPSKRALFYVPNSFRFNLTYTVT